MAISWLLLKFSLKNSVPNFAIRVLIHLLVVSNPHSISVKKPYLHRVVLVGRRKRYSVLAMCSQQIVDCQHGYQSGAGDDAPWNGSLQETATLPPVGSIPPQATPTPAKIGSKCYKCCCKLFSRAECAAKIGIPFGSSIWKLINGSWNICEAVGGRIHLQTWLHNRQDVAQGVVEGLLGLASLVGGAYKVWDVVEQKEREKRLSDIKRRLGKFSEIRQQFVDNCQTADGVPLGHFDRCEVSTLGKVPEVKCWTAVFCPFKKNGVQTCISLMSDAISLGIGVWNVLEGALSSHSVQDYLQGGLGIAMTTASFLFWCCGIKEIKKQAGKEKQLLNSEAECDDLLRKCEETIRDLHAGKIKLHPVPAADVV